MRSKIMSRVATALVGLPLLIVVIGWGRPWHFSLLVLIATAIALWEYFSMIFPSRRTERLLGILLGAVVSFGLLFPGLPDPGSWLGGVTVVACLTYLFFGGELRERFQSLSWTLLGIFYIGYLLPHFFVLYKVPNGREWVTWVLLVIMGGDTVSYFVGTYFGRTRLAPEISPAKTVEGALGGTAASLIAGAIGGRVLLPWAPWPEMLLLSFVLSLLGQAGDLFESWIKRAFSVKDSGRLLPGHGGLLDRVDSLIFSVVFTVYYLRFLRL
ncbi:MAG: phosphatidate cytidylyltransferase [Deltaproteobacteria bacterium]|nr:phosphatidate cytidylyltransferase [Deltaproteobacteria bacterium]